MHLPEHFIIPRNPYAVPPMGKFTREPTRNLIYHIWPNRDNDNWKWNLDYLKHYIDQFDGVRSIGVAVDQNTVNPREIKHYLEDIRIDNWICVENMPQRREGTTFVPLMETLPRGENQITFYGHAKGVRHTGTTTNTPTIWAAAMYYLCLASPEKITEILRTKPIAGSFARYNDFHLIHHDVWHYSGTFFWFRNDEAFKRQWHDLAPNFFACVEAWPSRIFFREEAGVIFGDNCGDLYQLQVWRDYRQQLLDVGYDIGEF
jgi:hypothetical protein